MTPVQQVLAKCDEVRSLALKLYGLDLSKVAITFNLKGRVAGYARWRQQFGVRTMDVRFNHDMIVRGDTEALRDMVNDTVPHEFAHIVCYMNPTLGKDHNYGWATVCRALGGTGKRTHDTEVVYGRGITYEYTTDRGQTVRMNERLHQKVQIGIPLRYKRGLGTVTKGCAYSMVGHQGRTLAEPVVRKAVSNVVTPAYTGIPAFKPFPKFTLEHLVKLPPVTPMVKTVAPMTQQGLSKASIARAVMLSGHTRGLSYEEIVQAIMQATGHDRQLSRSYYKGNYARVGVPAPQ